MIDSPEIKLCEWAEEVGNPATALTILLNFIDRLCVETLLSLGPIGCERGRKDVLSAIKTLHDEIERKTRDKGRDN
jgi:hypothetical protein